MKNISDDLLGNKEFFTTELKMEPDTHKYGGFVCDVFECKNCQGISN